MVKEALDCPSTLCIMSPFDLRAHSRLSYGLLLWGLRPHQDNTFSLLNAMNGENRPQITYEPVEVRGLWENY